MRGGFSGTIPASGRAPVSLYPGAIRCAWCKALVQAAKPGHEADPISHGCCQRCRDEFHADIEARRRTVSGSLR